MNSGAEHGVGQHREIVHGGAGRGRADDELSGECVCESLHRRGMPDIGDVRLAMGAADPDQPRSVVMGGRGLEQRIGGDRIERHADHGAVVRAERVKLVGHRNAAGGRLVLHDDQWVARDVLADMARDEPSEQVIGASRARADDKADPLATVKARHVVCCPGRYGGEENETQHEQPHPVLPGPSAARNPESIIPAIAVMDSGLATVWRPGMTAGDGHA